MSELQAFFHMGGYAAYVWSAYAITFIVLLGNVWFAKSAHRKMLSDLSDRHAINELRNTRDRIEES